MEHASLYEKYGGHDGIRPVVDLFYKLILADPDVGTFFAESNIEMQVHHQTNFLSSLLGGPNLYEGRKMRELHAGMKITEKEFGKVVNHLEEALTQSGVIKEDVESILKVVGTVKADILNI